MKPTTTTLQLVDRSVKVLRGVEKDVLIQVDKFSYLVDFIVLDTHLVSNSNAQIPVSISNLPWFADIDNFLVTGQISNHWNAQDRRNFMIEVKNSTRWPLSVQILS